MAAAATTGVLVAYGIRANLVTAPFLFLGRHLGGFRDGMYPQSTVVLAGFLLHGAWVIAWCVAFALLARDAGRVIRIPLAAVVTALAFIASSNLMGSALQNSGIGGARWVFLHLVLGLAMYLGTRFAK